ncbi:hypothetical protein EDC55_101126 [Allofrancisella inopinata]|uniref:Uncharacterized protein n=1 Tax=Allofrancisella inopinata TaxID=1085647 RepID=A0AAE7CS22_9GAMM|nr:hypothetical protein [Allofrancisella inopinata]QIV96303.1 hypothetical protein E4K63_05450 [Allofrancisella inopinata]TDT74580.1 hypothetical protein EDC55_101126 [Allofrancisella inopinata]
MFYIHLFWAGKMPNLNVRRNLQAWGRYLKPNHEVEVVLWCTDSVLESYLNPLNGTVLYPAKLINNQNIDYTKNMLAPQRVNIAQSITELPRQQGHLNTKEIRNWSLYNQGADIARKPNIPTRLPQPYNGLERDTLSHQKYINQYNTKVENLKQSNQGRYNHLQPLLNIIVSPALKALLISDGNVQISDWIITNLINDKQNNLPLFNLFNKNFVLQEALCNILNGYEKEALTHQARLGKFIYFLTNYSNVNSAIKVNERLNKVLGIISNDNVSNRRYIDKGNHCQLYYLNGRATFYEKVYVARISDLFSISQKSYINLKDLFYRLCESGIGSLLPFASDIARLFILNTIPGLYIDSDIMPNTEGRYQIKSLDALRKSLAAKVKSTNHIFCHAMNTNGSFENGALLNFEPGTLNKFLEDTDLEVKNFSLIGMKEGENKWNVEIERFNARLNLDEALFIKNNSLKTISNTPKYKDLYNAFKEKNKIGYKVSQDALNADLCTISDFAFEKLIFNRLVNLHKDSYHDNKERLEYAKWYRNTISKMIVLKQETFTLYSWGDIGSGDFIAQETAQNNITRIINKTLGEMLISIVNDALNAYRTSMQVYKNTHPVKYAMDYGDRSIKSVENLLQSLSGREITVEKMRGIIKDYLNSSSFHNHNLSWIRYFFRELMFYIFTNTELHDNKIKWRVGQNGKRNQKILLFKFLKLDGVYPFNEWITNLKLNNENEADLNVDMLSNNFIFSRQGKNMIDDFVRSLKQ